MKIFLYVWCFGLFEGWTDWTHIHSSKPEGKKLWSSLHESLRSGKSVFCFKQLLKTQCERFKLTFLKILPVLLYLSDFWLGHFILYVNKVIIHVITFYKLYFPLTQRSYSFITPLFARVKENYSSQNLSDKKNVSRVKKTFWCHFGYLNYSATFVQPLSQLSFAMARGRTQETNKYKPQEHFPDTFATRMRSARSPATTQHKIISNKHKGKTKQTRTN